MWIHNYMSERMWELYIILVEAYNCSLYTDDIIVVIMAAPDSRSQSFSRFRPLEYVFSV